jgi:nucleotide-binding universal stress UspA family protein
VATAEKYGCDAIVMASHGRSGLNRLFLGSETQKVLAHTHLPVLVLVLR